MVLEQRTKLQQKKQIKKHTQFSTWILLYMNNFIIKTPKKYLQSNNGFFVYHHSFFLLYISQIFSVNSLSFFLLFSHNRFRIVEIALSPNCFCDVIFEQFSALFFNFEISHKGRVIKHSKSKPISSHFSHHWKRPIQRILAPYLSTDPSEFVSSSFRQRVQFVKRN